MTTNKISQFTIYHNNSDEYHKLKHEVFTSDLYYFETDNSNPFIIDAGAHIGLSTVYFKKNFPGANIIAIEPNPHNFKLLQTNIFENQIGTTTLIQSALSDHSGYEKLFIDQTDEQWFSTSSFHTGSWAGVQKTKDILVKTQLLEEFITQPVDFLKLDIEGAEQKVLIAAKKCMPLIKEMHVEFHTHPSQSLSKLVDFLEMTHVIELFQGTKKVTIKKARGLIQIRAIKKRK